MLLCVLSILVVILLFLFSISITCRFQRHLPVGYETRCLLLIAHPDDECMFFGPTIVQLMRLKCKLYVLCVSTGNADNLGHLRKYELLESCQCFGIKSSDVTIMNVAGLLDGQSKWETEKLARLVLQHIERLDIERVLTFDNKGVSGHPNHISCFHALQFLYSNGLVPSGVQIFVLESVSLLRKFSGLFDLYISFLFSTFMVQSPPWSAWSAMRKHKTQLVWFRCLFIFFSRYSYVNSFRRIALHRFMVNPKNKIH